MQRVTIALCIISILFFLRNNNFFILILLYLSICLCYYQLVSCIYIYLTHIALICCCDGLESGAGGVENLQAVLKAFRTRSFFEKKIKLSIELCV
jgi:hypothetical protein